MQEKRTPLLGVRSMTAMLGTPRTVSVTLPVWLIDYVEVADGYELDQGGSFEFDSEFGPQWECETCGEYNDPTFDVCWQCQNANLCSTAG